MLVLTSSPYGVSKPAVKESEVQGEHRGRGRERESVEGEGEGEGGGRGEAEGEGEGEKIHKNCCQNKPEDSHSKNTGIG